MGSEMVPETEKMNVQLVEGLAWTPGNRRSSVAQIRSGSYHLRSNRDGVKVEAERGIERRA